MFPLEQQSMRKLVLLVRILSYTKKSLITFLCFVGRTGAGKSTLLTAILRMTEPSGTIWIDDQNICQMGLHDLRKQISIIPQDPLVFATSLRRNLDPFDTFSDAELWSALSQVNIFWFAKYKKSLI